ncbi:hypothetical protein RJ640_024175 [Escallonia rubra]|uniref:F-box domain-containing protein n=1 Tax=Escallonia rubra TaxID=112253 RepID=A0AA88R7K9_9ASTE|nr:hypothetical protein RJ640_024175 [Escallonia rubra]
MDSGLPPTKFQITGVASEEDRISNLPDAVLTHIISLLPPKEAVKTRLVSTRWKYIWTTLPTLRFEMPRVDKKPFMEFVEKTLNLRNGMPFQRFSIHCSENNIYDRIYASLCNVVKGGVQELDLRFCDGSKNVRLPWDALMTCRTLVCLRLGHAFVLDVPAEVCFPCLKVLHLRSVVYANDTSLQNLLSGCPVLEELYLRRYLFEKVDNLRRTDYVSVPSLKRLKLRVDQLDVERRKSIGETVLFEVSIDAPSLECLVLLDSVSGGYYYVKSLPSLREATIDVSSSDRLEPHDGWWFNLNRWLFSLFRSSQSVERLTLSSSTLWALGFARQSGNLPMFSNLVNLSLGLAKCHGWKLLPFLLESMPNLEVLALADGLVPAYDAYQFNWNIEPQHVPACLLFKLKTIEIRHFDARMKTAQLMFIEYLLMNAKVLETMQILCAEHLGSSMRKELLKLPRWMSVRDDLANTSTLIKINYSLLVKGALIKAIFILYVRSMITLWVIFLIALVAYNLITMESFPKFQAFDLSPIFLVSLAAIVVRLLLGGSISRLDYLYVVVLVVVAAAAAAAAVSVPRSFSVVTSVYEDML